MTRKGLIITIIIIIVLAAAIIFYFGLRETTREAPTTLKPVFTELPEITPAISVDIKPSTEAEKSTYQALFPANILSPDKKQIAVFQKEGGVNVLKILDAANGKIKKTIKINIEDVTIAWPKPEEIILLEKPNAALPNSAWAFNLKNNTLAYLFKEEIGLMLSWLDEGKLLLKFNVNPLAPNQGTLALIDEKTKEQTNLPWITLPSKCAFGLGKLYCAVPKEITATVILPDDYLKQKFLSQDKILAIDLKKTKIYILFSEDAPLIDAVGLEIIDGKLFFTNRYDDGVYKVKL